MRKSTVRVLPERDQPADQKVEVVGPTSGEAKTSFFTQSALSSLPLENFKSFHFALLFDLRFVPALRLNSVAQLFDHLCDLGAELDLRNSSGETVLHESVREQNLNRVLSLLMLGASAAIGDNAGAHPLHYAVEVGHPPSTLFPSSCERN
ncbi:unnamed protein product [Schistocephalus solidus]|uniref:ANK_REP_REGION domain-containing protein n=1 Tax=Schistocephalus solidus TaxID=70667 RepID=A0A183SR78_SCHSO|nr:unnamed protein product [Schistocephalus solidus]